MTAPKRTLSLPADVARCDGGQCPLRNSCLRYLADPLPDRIRVVWFTEPPNNGDECDYYILGL